MMLRSYGSGVSLADHQLAGERPSQLGCTLVASKSNDLSTCSVAAAGEEKLARIQVRVQSICI